MTASYRIPIAQPMPYCAELEIKKSRFLGFGFAVEQREQALFHVEQLRVQYADARHVCWAYVLGNPKNAVSASFDDDGEPSGTAGKPILQVLQHKAIGNVLIAVVRYFGGIKLGAGGLMRAYSGTAQAVIDAMRLEPYVAVATLQLVTDFAHESQLRQVVQQQGGAVQRCLYQPSMKFDVMLELTLAESSLPALLAATQSYAKPLDHQ